MTTDRRVFPVAIPPRPTPSASPSPRVRQRFKQSLRVWRAAAGQVHAMNMMYGRPNRMYHDRGAEHIHPDTAAVHEQVWKEALSWGKQLAEARRSFCSTGVQSARELLKATGEEYVLLRSRLSQVQFLADAIDEPEDNVGVDILTALPPGEAEWYASEQNVVDWTGKSQEQVYDL